MSWPALITIVVLIGAWIFAQERLAATHQAFDPYPYHLLDLLIAVVAIVYVIVVELARDADN